MANDVPIIVDTRGEDATVEAIAEVLPDVQIIRRALDCGDIAWYGSGLGGLIGVERKTADDLLNSLPPSTRLQEQLTRMISTYDFPMIMIQGEIGQTLSHLERMSVPCRWTQPGIDNFLLSWQLAGVYVVHATNMLGERIRMLYNWSMKTSHLMQRRKRLLLPTGPASARAEAMAALVPGLGIKRSEALAEYSLCQLSTMEEDAWKAMKIPGFGTTMKRKVQEALRSSEL